MLNRKNPSGNRPSLVIIVDTNALHHLGLYLDFAIPLGLIKDYSDRPIEEIKSEYKTSKVSEDLQRGFKFAQYLKKRSDKGDTIIFSGFSKLELKCGTLKGKAIVNAATLGLPYRMWNRLDEYEILSRLSDNDYSDVDKRLNCIISTSNSAGINIAPYTTKDYDGLFDLADWIMSSVYLDCGDCIVYAHALFETADVIVTGDGYFKRVIANIRSAPKQPKTLEGRFYSTLRKKIESWFTDIMGYEEDEIVIPKTEP